MGNQMSVFDPGKPSYLTAILYELKVMIVQNLDQRYIIHGIAKTCNMFRELAYPIAYKEVQIKLQSFDRRYLGRVHFERHRGIPHIQHLNLYVDGHTDIDTVVIILAGIIHNIPPNKLISFVLKFATIVPIRLSLETLVTSLENQRNLQRLSFPILDAKAQPFTVDYEMDSAKPSSLQNLHTTKWAESKSLKHREHFVGSSSNLSQYHTTYQASEHGSFLYSLSFLSFDSQGILPLASAITKLTLRGCKLDFRILGMPKLPQVQAIDLDDCSSLHRFFSPYVQVLLPALIACRLKSKDWLDIESVLVSLRAKKGLRELVIESVWYPVQPVMELLSGMETLEILCMVASDESGGWYFAPQLPLQELAAIRFLGFQAKYCRPLKGMLPKGRNSNICVDAVALSAHAEQLQVLFCHCPSSDDDDHPHLRCSWSEETGLENFSTISRADKQRNGFGPVCRTHIFFPLWGRVPNIDNQNIASNRSSELKELLLNDYAQDNYYFLEQFVDIMYA